MTAEKPSGLTVDTLHILMATRFAEADRRYEQRFDAQEKAVGAALQAAKEAVSKAETAAEKRFDSVNEFRASLADQAANLMPRNEVTVIIANLAERVNKLEAGSDMNAGRGRGFSDSWGYLVGAIGAVAAVVAVIIAVN